MKKMDIRKRAESQICMACRWWTMSKKLGRRSFGCACAFLAVFCFAFALWGESSPPQQSPPPGSDQKQDQGIPDAPSTVQPPKPAPETPLPQEHAQPEPPQTPGANEPAPRENTPPAQEQNPAVKPPVNIRTVPEGGATKQAGAQEELFKIVTNVNQVMVPVTVKDDSGRLVSGLLAKNFSVREGGKKQTLNFFTSDPFAL